MPEKTLAEQWIEGGCSREDLPDASEGVEGSEGQGCYHIMADDSVVVTWAYCPPDHFNSFMEAVKGMRLWGYEQ